MKGKLKINSKIRKMVLISGPFVFSVFSSFVYIIAFSPAKNSPDFSNVVFVFFAAFGWSSQILYGNREMFRIAYYFSAASVILPLLVFELLRLYPYDIPQGRIILGMIIAGNLWLFVIYRNLRESKTG